MFLKRRATICGIALLVFFFAICPQVVCQSSQPSSDVQPATETAPVMVDGKAIFDVPGLLSFPAKERAAAISARIEKLSKNVTAKEKSLSVVDAEGHTDIGADDLIVMSVTDQDAKVAGMSRHALASIDAQRISSALATLRKEYSLKSLMLGGVYAVVVTAFLILILRLLGFLFPKLYRKLDSWRGRRIPSLRIQKYELVPSDRIADFAIELARLLRLAVLVVVVYFYASLVLGFFPWTRGYAGILVGYVLSPLKLVGREFVAYLPNVFFIAVVVLVSYYVIRFTRTIFGEIGKGTITLSGFHDAWAEPTYKIVRFLILALTAIVIFPYLPGAKSPAFQGVSIFLGVLFSLGSTSAVANVVAGIILTYMRAFKVGDRVRIADTVGDVIEESLLVTRIRTIKNVEITIANSMVLNSHIINFSASAQHEGLILHTTVTIGYDAPWRTIRQLLIDAASATEHILKEPRPFILQTALDDFYVHYELNAYTNQPSQMASIYSDLHERIQDKFYEAGVEIMSPHFTNVRDGNRVAIPDEYLPKEYAAPSFRLGLDNILGGIKNPTKTSDL